ncbi:hypothetical protein [Leuconostoc fallax]|uniref:hypothetical protein n=1 Tax=Leuconostoc fallax TaxID=1251 RepID=UPI001C1EA1F6|nr:hypothetical protein [Leuconostoc fallax]MBU7455679.1 hypothetical protein [Leuconostoc fallax]
MAIQIDLSSVIIKTKEFLIGGKTYTATYTDALDSQYSDLMLRVGHFLKPLEGEEFDKKTLDEQIKELSGITGGMHELATKFLTEAVGAENTKEIVEYVNDRTYTLATIAGIIFQAGQGDEVEKELAKRSHQQHQANRRQKKQANEKPAYKDRNKVSNINNGSK